MEIEYFVNPARCRRGPARRRVLARPLDRGLHGAGSGATACEPENLRLREHEKDELAHYAKRTVDIDYRVPHRLERADGHRQPHRLRPQAALEVQRQVAHVLRRGAQGARRALRHRAGGRRRPRAPGLPRSTPTARRRSAARSASCSASIPSWRPSRSRCCRCSRSGEEIVRTAPGAPRRAGPALDRVIYDDTAAIGRLYRRQDEVGTALLRHRRRADRRRRRARGEPEIGG